MTSVWIAAAGFAAHVLSLLLAEYSQWLLTKVARGRDRLDLGRDLGAFLRWFASRFSSNYGSELGY